MPGGNPLCNKCRSGYTDGSDSWCGFCSSASALSDSARYRFQSLAHRALAEEVVLQASRQVHGLIQLDKQVNSERASLADRLANAKRQLAEVTNQVEKSAAPKSSGVRKSPREAAPAAKVEEAAPKEGKGAQEVPDYGSESFSEESEEEEEAEADKAEEEAVPLARPEGRPKGSEQPRSPSREPLARKKVDKKRRRRSRSRGRRGGKKHQQQYRGLQDPNLKFHKRAKVEPIDLWRGHQYQRW